MESQIYKDIEMKRMLGEWDKLKKLEGQLSETERKIAGYLKEAN